MVASVFRSCPNALNTAELREAGIKSSLLDNKMFLAVGGYRQTRTSFTADTQQVLSTLSTGMGGRDALGRE